ncbi:MAG: nitroreductase family protein [Burkholderiales bacterium]
MRRYGALAVPPNLVESVLACALSAPSPHNRQPVRLALIQSFVARARLVEAMGEQLRTDRLRDGDPAEAIQEDVERSGRRLLGAPLLLLVALSLEDMDRYPDGARREAEYMMAVQASAMAGQNIALAAHAAGLASCWLCAPLFCPDVASTALGLPQNWRPQGLMTIGYGSGPARFRPRKGLPDILLRL